MNVLVVPDLHCPWQHPEALGFLRRLRKAVRPDAVVLLGDELDAAAWSRFAKEPDMDSPSAELAAARAALRPFRDLFPEAMVCESNHTARPWLRAAEAGLTGEFLRDASEVLDTPGWVRQSEWWLDGVVYMHGEGFSGATAHVKAATQNRRPTVIGHVHAHAGINYLTGPFDRIWGMNAGCLIDPAAPAFRYGRHLRNRPCLGAAVVRDGVPALVPLGV